jgi:hypothetical protein
MAVGVTDLIGVMCAKRSLVSLAGYESLPFLFQFTILFKGTYAPGVVGEVMEVPGMTAIYTPISATSDDPGNDTHWDIQRYGDGPTGPAPLTAKELSGFANLQEDSGTLPIFVYQNPAYTGGRQVQWPNTAPPLPYWVK